MRHSGLNGPHRVLGLAFGFVATMGWAASFWLLRRGSLPVVMGIVELAAVVSWPVLGIIMVRASGRFARECFDACLRTLVRGSVLLGVGALANVGLWACRFAVPDSVLVGVHLGILLAAALVMTAAYRVHCGRIGIDGAMATRLWLVGLMAPFGLALGAGLVAARLT